MARKKSQPTVRRVVIIAVVGLLLIIFGINNIRKDLRLKKICTEVSTGTVVDTQTRYTFSRRGGRRTYCRAVIEYEADGAKYSMTTKNRHSISDTTEKVYYDPADPAASYVISDLGGGKSPVFMGVIFLFLAFWDFIRLWKKEGHIIPDNFREILNTALPSIKKYKNRILPIGCMAFLTVFTLLLISGMAPDLIKAAGLKVSCKAMTQGESKHVRKRVSGDDTYYSADIEYEVDGKVYSIRSEERKRNFKNSGSIMTVYYDKDNPERAYINSDMEVNFKYLIVLIIFTAIVSRGVFLEIKAQIKSIKNKEEKE